VAESALAATYKLSNGQELTGELLPTSANDLGVQVKTGEGQYQRVNWGEFSQEDLRQFAENSKLQPLVEPFIEISQEEKIKQTEVKITEPTRLPRPQPGSILGAMFSSPLGVFLLLVLYAGIIYAGYEVAIFRGQPPALVAGLAAIPFVGILSPIVFLSMPTRVKHIEEAAPMAPPAGTQAAAAIAAEEAAAQEAANPTGGLRIAQEAPAAESALPEPVVYARGQFTFNRRFFETKFPNLFGVVRREADKDMILVVKTSRTTLVANRISRIAANDMHLQVQRGHAQEEVQVQFMEIQEVRFQHKDSPVA
jgi:hypothetical protein